MGLDPKTVLGVAIGELILIAFIMLIAWVIYPLFAIEAFDKEGNRVKNKVGAFIRNNAELKNPKDFSDASGKRKVVVYLSISLLAIYALSLCVLFFMYLAQYEAKPGEDGWRASMSEFLKKKPQTTPVQPFDGQDLAKVQSKP